MKMKIPRIFPKQLRAVHSWILKPVQSFPTSSTPCKIKVNKKDVIVLQNTLQVLYSLLVKFPGHAPSVISGATACVTWQPLMRTSYVCHHALEPLREQHGIFLPPERALHQCKTLEGSRRSSAARLWASLPPLSDDSAGQARVWRSLRGQESLPATANAPLL